MSKLVLLLLVGVFCKVFCETENSLKNEVPASKDGTRQKRLLFYDEEGTLVKTYTNPYLRDFMFGPEKIPIFGSFLNPFIHLFKPSTFSITPTAYMIPVSSDVVQQLNNDPTYHNKLLFIPAKDVSVEANPICSGKRNQVPAPSSCSNFLNCWDGWAFEQECPAGLLFSSSGYCDYPQNVDCSNRRLSDETQKRCSKDFETFRNELQCSEFFVCVNQVPVQFKCPADLAFSTELGICDYPQRVNCSATAAISEPSSMPSSDKTMDLTPSPAAATTEGQPPKIKSILSNSVFNSWTTTHVATSRQEAIRQLELTRLAKVHV